MTNVGKFATNVLFVRITGLAMMMKMKIKKIVRMMKMLMKMIMMIRMMMTTIAGLARRSKL